MSTYTPQLSLAALRAVDSLDATVGPIGFVVRREPNRDWAIHNVANQRYHILAFAVSGRARYECDGRAFGVGRGHATFFPKGTPHSAQTDPELPWAFFSMAFDLVHYSLEGEAVILGLPRQHQLANVVEFETLFRELERLWVSREPGFLLRCRSIILQLLHIFVRSCWGGSVGVLHAEKLAAITALLQQNPARTFSVIELAEMAGLSLSRFRMLFKQYTGHSVVRYQNWLRINRAKDLLVSGEYSVTEAAAETGFLDVYYFSRLFKQLTGVNPSHYRNQ